MSARSAFLIQGSLAYALDVVGRLAPGRLDAPTPCPGWDVRALVTHLTTSVAVLSGAGAPRHAGRGLDDPVPAFTEAVCLLLTRLPRSASRPGDTGRSSTPHPDRATTVGAVEVAVHGWDVARACGCTRPLPGLIAADLLALAPTLTPLRTRPDLFGAPVPVRPGAAPGDQLVALMGRSPSWAPPARTLVPVEADDRPDDVSPRRRP